MVAQKLLKSVASKFAGNSSDVKPTKKAPLKKAGQRAGGTSAKENAKVIWEKKRVAMGKMSANWPEDCVVDDRHVSYLPLDWTAAIKMTENGLLLPCFIGPEPGRKRFFHKVDLEKHLGRTLSSDERGEKSRVVPENLRSEFPPSHFLACGAETPRAQYIVDRCRRIHGMTIEDAIEKFMYKDTHGLERHYNMTDLQYDVNAKFLSIIPTKPGPAPRKPMAAATAPCHKSTATSSTGEPKRLSGSTSIAASAPSSLTSASSVGRSIERPSAAILRDVQISIINPLLKEGAAGVQGQMNVFTVLGVGHTCGFDPILLSTLPAVLAKKVSDRTEFDKVVLKSLSNEMAKAVKSK